MTTDVLIVGAGPSGLVLANLLARLGVEFRIVDRKEGPVAESRAAIVHVRTLELLDRLGLASAMVERGVQTTRVEVYARGRPAASFPLVPPGTEKITRFPFALILEQDRTERILVEGLRRHGKAVEWGTELVGLDHTRAVVRRGSRTDEEIPARWVVGADGASSRVRHALGLGFAGKTYDQTGFLADVDVDAASRTSLDPGTLRLNLARGGFVGMASLSNGRFRLFGAVPPELAPRYAGDEVSHEAYASVSLGDVQHWFDQYFFVEARLSSVAWTALYRIHSRMAERFRAGNVYLVGDAAHIHSPAGGQGMNLGIGDAFNLGWKMAMVARGEAREGLLDSYEAERYPAARSVLQNADRGFYVEAMASPAAEWARAHVATRLVGPVLRLDVARRLVFRLFSQTWIGYRDSPAVARGHRSAGVRAPQVSLPWGTRHDLLVFSGPESDPALPARRQAVENLLRRYRAEVAVHIVPATDRELYALCSGGSTRLVLLRPDGHVAYAGSFTDLAGLDAHLDALYVRSAP